MPHVQNKFSVTRILFWNQCDQNGVVRQEVSDDKLPFGVDFSVKQKSSRISQYVAVETLPAKIYFQTYKRFSICFRIYGSLVIPK